jgi:hypothetical protein
LAVIPVAQFLATPVIRYRIDALRWEGPAMIQRFVWAADSGAHPDDTITSVRPQPRMRARFTIVSRDSPRFAQCVEQVQVGQKHEIVWYLAGVV